MSPINNEAYELVAKHCPKCEHLIMAKVEEISSSDARYSGYKCSYCNWISPGSSME